MEALASALASLGTRGVCECVSEGEGDVQSDGQSKVSDYCGDVHHSHHERGHDSGDTDDDDDGRRLRRGTRELVSGVSGAFLIRGALTLTEASDLREAVVRLHVAEVEAAKGRHHTSATKAVHTDNAAHKASECQSDAVASSTATR
jgi:hypothetical protein